MTAPIAPTSPTSAASSASSTSALGKAALNENDFLQMLVAQMKNQDPMNPMQGTEFATQLAQFSSVEQLIQLNNKLDTQAAASQQAASTSLGISLVGHNVIVPGNGIDVSAGETPQITMDLPSSAKSVVVSAIDAGGHVAGVQTFDAVGAGRQTLNLSDMSLDAGHYTYTVQAQAEDGTAIAPTTYSTARVTGMALSNGEVQVRINGTLVPVSQITEVIAPAPAPAKSATTTTTTTQGATQS